jgi:hypothetical protein
MLNNFISRKVVYINGLRHWPKDDYEMKSDGFHFSFQLRKGGRITVEHYVFGFLVGVRSIELTENWPPKGMNGPTPGLKI